MSETDTGSNSAGSEPQPVVARTPKLDEPVTWPAITKTEIMSKKRHRDRFS